MGIKVTVDQCCSSCGTDASCEGSISELFGVGNLDRIATEWSCPECGIEYELETPFDTTLFDRSGFHSWVGSVGDNPACIVIESGSDTDDDSMGPMS